MEPVFVLILLFLSLVLLVFPLWAFVRIRRQGEELKLQEDKIKETEIRLAALSRKVEYMEKGADLPGRGASEPVAPAVTAPHVAPQTIPVEIPRVIAVEPGAAIPVEVAPPPLPSTPALPPMPAARPVFIPSPARARSAINWEQFMGVKLFAWLGGLALFLGAVFFVKLSIEQGWVAPEVRVALGYLLGIALLAAGPLLTQKRYTVTAQTLCGTGVVTLYGMTFASHAVYHFFGAELTFGLMILITATAFLLAVRLEAKVVALLGMLGGFLTPILLSTGQDNPSGLFGYIALLDAGLIAVLLVRNWDFLFPLAALGTALMEIGWAEKFLQPGKVITAIVVSLTFNFLFLVGFALARRRGKIGPTFTISVSGMVFLSFIFAAIFALVPGLGISPAYWLGFVFLADGCLLAMVSLGENAGFATLSGGAVYLLLAGWTTEKIIPALLPWALGAYLAFAALHSAFPLVLRRIRGTTTQQGAGLFAPLALLLVLGPVLNSSAASFAVWPAVLLLDLVAIAAAWVSGGLAGVIAVLVLTLVGVGESIVRIPRGESGNTFLWVIAGFALLFYAVGLIFGRRGKPSFVSRRAETRSDLNEHLPALSALLPFALLIMAMARLNPPSPSPIFGLALLLTALTLGLSRLLLTEALAGCALAGVLALGYTWREMHGWAAHPSTELSWFSLFYAIFFLFPFGFHRAFLDKRGPWLASAAAGPLLFPLFFRLIKHAWPNDLMGLLPAAFAVPSIIAIFFLIRSDPVEHPRRLGRLALFGGVALLFITLIFPIQFERQWITIAWALEGAAVIWLFRRVPHRGLPIAGVLLLGTAFVRLIFNPRVFSYQLHSAHPIFNGYLYTYGIVVICLLAGARLLSRPPQRVLGLQAPTWLNAMGGVLLFVLVNIEIADFFARGSERLTFDFSGNFGRDMTYTIAWALYAFGMLILGIWKRSRGLRYAALALLGAALAKLFLHDLAQLAQLYRIGALFAVAIVAILASFLYQRYLPTDEKKTPPAL